MFKTPLRYPGGKSIMTPFLEKLFLINNWDKVVYSEPYAGGAGAGVNLLLSNKVERIVINDANIGIYSFWQAVRNETDRFCEKVLNCPINLETWAECHKLFQKSREPSFELGFATFFLTRTNRSGILNAGPIGGNSPEKQEAAKYKIDCRFNRSVLVKKIHDIGKERERISIFNMDAIDFLRQQNNQPGLFVYLDPPYYQQGKSLYMSYYRPQDHQDLACFLEHEAVFDWVMSYDSVEAIRGFYQHFNLLEYEIQYSARTSRVGKELLASSPGMQLPDEIKLIKK